MAEKNVSQCPGIGKHACGKWFHNHPSGLCRECRYRAATTKPKRSKKTSTAAVPGSLRWAEERGGLIGGYEED